MSPNVAEGGCCTMMNAFLLAVSLSEVKMVADALKEWEPRERPIIKHTQRWSRLYGMVTAWPDLPGWDAFRLVGVILRLQRQFQRAARHQPYGTSPQCL